MLLLLLLLHVRMKDKANQDKANWDNMVIINPKTSMLTETLELNNTVKFRWPDWKSPRPHVRISHPETNSKSLEEVSYRLHWWNPQPLTCRWPIPQIVSRARSLHPPKVSKSMGEMKLQLMNMKPHEQHSFGLLPLRGHNPGRLQLGWPWAAAWGRLRQHQGLLVSPASRRVGINQLDGF